MLAKAKRDLNLKCIFVEDNLFSITGFEECSQIFLPTCSIELAIEVIDIVFELRSKQPKRSFRCFMVQGETLYS